MYSLVQSILRHNWIGAAKSSKHEGQLTSRQSMVFNSKKPVFLKNPHNYIKEEHIKLFNLSSVIFVAIVHDEQAFGWLTFDQLGEEFDYSMDELTLLEQVGKRLGLYLSRKDDEVSIRTGHTIDGKGIDDFKFAGGGL
ncbi:hypothetical protein [Bacillus sp. ISL-34]|uniref:hypothetical protein n=1 Tax=Bacillus sp. ISL-34 TaxID=2819121 RepID=UPI0025707740|nr:hypothetical protein [Bacillus sp. ISL-34]